MRVVVIIPTYNEAASTPAMIEELAQVFGQIRGHEMLALYVDDSSPDGTAARVKEKQSKYKWLHLLVNPQKGGLGVAYAAGMKYAMEKLAADFLMEFDGDFQHPPQHISSLVAKINEGYDYIIGSRYVPGGSIPKTWGFTRKFLSAVGNLVARVLLVLPQIHDVTTGFKLARVKGFMDGFDFDTLLSRQFAYKVQLLFYMVNKGAKAVEVPFAFAPRTSGESKLIKNEMKETLRVIFLLQWQNPKLRKFIKFGIVGFVGYVINAVGLAVFARLGLVEWLVWAAAAELAIINNFTWNNLWTFKSDQIAGPGKLLVKFVQFNLTSTGALIIQTVLGTLGVAVFGAGSRQILLLLIIAFAIVPYNWFMYNTFIWPKTAPSSK